MLGTSPAESLASVPAKPMPLVTSPSIPLTERLIEYAVPRGEIKVAGEAQCLWRPQVPTHPGVLPFDRQRSLVSDLVQRPDHRLEIDVSPPWGDEVPAAPGVYEVEVGPEDTAASVESAPRVLDVHVIDPVPELLDEGVE